jgi:uncharacterized membrane protein (DUF2068 family)
MRWADWLSVVAGGLYIPVEVYELTKSVTALKVALLAINVAIVVYLVRELWRGRKARAAAGEITA